MVNKFKVLFSISGSNIRKWFYDYKIPTILLILLLFIYNYFQGVFQFGQFEGYRTSPWLFPFLFTNPYMMTFIFLGIIIIFCDAPFVDSLQMFTLSRCGKKMWYFGQIMYICLTSFIYCLFLVVIPILTRIGRITFINGWGKVINSFAFGGATADVMSVISTKIVGNYTPIKAMLFSFLLAWLACVWLGVLLFLMNMIFENHLIGILLASISLIMTIVVHMTESALLLHFSPLSWVLLENHALTEASGMPRPLYMMTFYLITLVVMVGAIFVAAKRKDI